MDAAEAREAVRGCIQALEESYEFFLAYAAQGVSDDRASTSGGQLRDFLARAQEAVEGITPALRDLVAREDVESVDAWGEMLEVVEEDARRARAALRLVRGEASVSSQLVDNLNANIHLRALLTDLFLVDEALG